MYHPSRGGVRGGRDQFSWEDVKVDKHRENYLGHSIKAPVGRWQKGKDLHWYARDKTTDHLNSEAMKEEILRIKEEEEQAMREALGLAPKRAAKPQGNQLDKHEFAELTKRGSTAEDLGAGHAEAAHVHGLGFSRGPPTSEESSLPAILKSEPVEKVNISMPTITKNEEEDSEDESSRKKRKREERRHEKHEKHEERRHEKHEKHEERRHEKHEKREKRHSRDSDDKRKHKKHKEKRRHDSD